MGGSHALNTPFHLKRNMCAAAAAQPYTTQPPLPTLNIILTNVVDTRFNQFISSDMRRRQAQTIRSCRVTTASLQRQYDPFAKAVKPRQ